MKVTINETELEGIVKIEVTLQRDVDRYGFVQAHLGTPEVHIEREIREADLADIVAFESFADITAPAIIELEFTSKNNIIVEVKLTDVMIDRPMIDYQAGRLVELVHGRGGTLELVTPQGETYTRDVSLYPEND